MKLPKPRTVVLLVCSIILFFTVASVAGQTWRLTGHSSHRRLVRQFALDDEWNVPSAYQALSLGICALLLFEIARRSHQLRRGSLAHWIILGAIFVLLACDEAFRIHERLGKYREDLPGGMGHVFKTGWVIFGLAFVAVVGLSYIRFLFRLPRRYAILFVIAGAIYVGGAVGMEIAASPLVESRGRDNYTYVLMSTLEEVMEMAGICIFLYALTSYLHQMVGKFTSPDTRSASYTSREPQSPPTPAT